MNNEDIRYCVEYVYKGPNSDFWNSSRRSFFKKMDDVSEFLIKIRDKKNEGVYCSKPVVYESNFIKWSDSSVDGMVASYEKRKEINNMCIEQEKKKMLLEN